MATTDEGSEMDDSTTGSLDALELPELPDTVWLRLLANALDPDAPPASADLIPVDDAVTPADDLTGLSDGVIPTEDLDDGDPTFDGFHHGGPDHHGDGGAALLPHHDPASDDPSTGGSHTGGHDHDPLGGHPWSDPHDDHSF